MTNFSASTTHGMVYSSRSTWADARLTSSNFENASAQYPCGTRKVAANDWRCYREFLSFDTSSIGAGSTVTQVNLKLVCTQDVSTSADFDIQIVKQDWSGQSPIAAGNMEAAFDGCLAGTADDAIWRNTSGISINTQYTSGNLSTDWVNKTGVTYYSLRSSNDYGNVEPTGNEYIQIASAQNATVGYRPVLTVAYTEAATGTLLKVNFNAQMQNLSGGIHG